MQIKLWGPPSGLPDPVRSILLSILAHQIPNGRKLKRKQRLWEQLAEEGVVPRKERLLQEKLKKPAAKGSSAEAAGGSPGPAKEFYDIWSDSSKTRWETSLGSETSEVQSLALA